MKTLFIIFVLLATVAIIVSTIRFRRWADRLSKKEVAQEEHQKTLDHLRNCIDADQKALTERYQEIAPWLRGDAVTLPVSYTVTEEDELRYKGKTASVVRNRLAHLLANDIIRNFPQPAVDEVNGRTRYSYHFIVREGENNG